MKILTTVVSHRNDFAQLINELDLKVGIEIGVDEGIFSEFILQNSNIKILHSIDAWSAETSKTLSLYAARSARHMAESGQNYCHVEELARERLSKFGARSNVIKSISWDASNLFENDSVDFIYFDGSHTTEGFGKDMQCWVPKVKKGGLLSGHDYCHKHRYGYGVIEVVDDFMQKHELKLNITKERKSPSWWAIK